MNLYPRYWGNFKVADCGGVCVGSASFRSPIMDKPQYLGYNYFYQQSSWFIWKENVMLKKLVLIPIELNPMPSNEEEMYYKLDFDNKYELLPFTSVKEMSDMSASILLFLLDNQLSNNKSILVRIEEM
jgi:hypothetical protein